jgi:Pyrimidine deaminase
MTSKDKFFMKLALQEASKGGIDVYPNPRVGAVVVSDGKVVSSGYHKTFGSHAC